MRPTRRQVGRCTALCSLVAVFVVGCSSAHDPKSPYDADELRKQEIVVDLSECHALAGGTKPCADLHAKDMRRFRTRSGVNGVPLKAVADDDDGLLRSQTFARLDTHWIRFPVGYGCDASLEGVFPDPAKDPEDITNYKLDALSALLEAATAGPTTAMWTVAYGLGGAAAPACTYGFAGSNLDGRQLVEQRGTPIGESDAAIHRWARVVRRVVKWFDLDLPKARHKEGACDPKPGEAKPFGCVPSLWNVEFGRDPNGAGGFTAATRQHWLAAYKAFATELRSEFPYPGNHVLILGPSVVLRSAEEAAAVDPAEPDRSWLYFFVDYVVAKKLPLSKLTLEVEAGSPAEAAAMLASVRKYVDAKGLLSEQGGPMPLVVTDLRIRPPEGIAANHAAYSVFQAAFYAATRMLWDGTVHGAIIGRVVRTPTVDPTSAKPADVAKSALGSDLFWYEHPKAPAGSLKPAAWPLPLFGRSHLLWGGGMLDACPPASGCVDPVGAKRRKSLVRIQVGGVDATTQTASESGVVGLATREDCVSEAKGSEGEPVDCVSGAAASGEAADVLKGRKRVARVMLASLHTEGASAKRVRIHDMRLQVKGLPEGVTSVGYRWARMDDSQVSWTELVYRKQGVLEVKDGAVHLKGLEPVPAVHYLELYY